MHVRFSFCAWLLVLLLSACTSAAKPQLSLSVPPLRILFIGNSLTYTNDLPGMLEKMSASETPPARCDSVTFPGVSLAFHRGTGFAQRKLNAHPWDFVILQEYSTRPLDRPDATTASVRFFKKCITAAGAQPILFENWTRQDRPGTSPTLRSRYQEISLETGVPLVHIGDAWSIAEQKLPWFKPFLDERHPAPVGTYLTACVLFEAVYHHNPAAATLPRGITPPQAAALQEIARTLPAPPLTFPPATTTTSK